MLFCLIILIEKSLYNAESSIIPVLRKVAQLDTKHKINGGPIINVFTGAAPDDVLANGTFKRTNKQYDQHEKQEKSYFSVLKFCYPCLSRPLNLPLQLN